MAHVHKFDIENYEDGVSIGICACGAVRYYPAYYSSPEILKRVNELNRTAGNLVVEMNNKKPGTAQTVPEKGEEFMVARIQPKNKELEDVINKVENGGGDATQLKTLLDGLPPVPERPVWHGRKDAMKVASYYKANKKQILKEIESLGEDATRERWNIPKTSWRQLVLRWTNKSINKKSHHKTKVAKSTESPRTAVPLIETKGKTSTQIHAEIEKNKDKIIELMAKHGIGGSLPLIGISDTALTDARRRWGMIDSKHHGVQLPPFNDNWTEAVQIQWLKTYEALNSK